MSCCSPNYRNSVNEKENQVNQKGNEHPPFLVKLVAVIIMVAGLFLAYLTN
jgi:hypothetical protein